MKKQTKTKQIFTIFKEAVQNVHNKTKALNEEKGKK